MSIILKDLKHKLHVCVFGLALLFFTMPAIADDYRWITTPDPGGDQQLIKVDPSICRIYEENLSYFAKQNTPMSCYRPIAPHLKDRIKEVEWEDLDPDRYPNLFRAIVVKYRYISNEKEDVIRSSLKYARDLDTKKIMVFRRAKLSLTGHIRIYERSTKPEPYWIIQYGYNDTSATNPDGFYRCIPTRGGGLESKLHLYIASEAKQELVSTIGTVVYPSSEGQSLRTIDGRLFVENIHPKAWIELNEVDVAMPMTDTVCVFQFKKSSPRRN